TKPKGQGFGLGLSLAYGLLRQYDGWIDLDSEPGRFTRVELYLPTEKKERTPKSIQHNGKGRLLVVDDESLVLNFAGMYLERSGYEVCKAMTPEEAIVTFRSYSSQIDLVITDLSLPGMSGQELIRILHDINPRARFLVSSGLEERELAEAAMEEGVFGA